MFISTSIRPLDTSFGWKQPSTKKPQQTMHQACCVLPTRVSRQELSLMPSQKNQRLDENPHPPSNPGEMSRFRDWVWDPLEMPCKTSWWWGLESWFWGVRSIRGLVGLIIIAPHFHVRCFSSGSSTNSSGTGQLSRVGWTVGCWFGGVKIPQQIGGQNWGNRLQMGWKKSLECVDFCGSLQKF